MTAEVKVREADSSTSTPWRKFLRVPSKFSGRKTSLFFVASVSSSVNSKSRMRCNSAIVGRVNGVLVS
eukprot:764996-Hanusia_phi.AAC.1